MIRISGLRLNIDYRDDILKSIAAKKLNTTESKIKNVTIFKRSIDARKKDDVHFIAALNVEINGNEQAVVNKCRSKNILIVKPYVYTAPAKKNITTPVIAGAGPAGLFAALTLARSGCKPIIIERGKNVTDRQRDIEIFWNTGKLNINSNVQFGEGGAGTFSDGKLNTGTKDIRKGQILRDFVKHGAPPEILFDAKPHIGTDRLPSVIKNIRKEIISLGGKFLFETTLTDITIKNNKVSSVTVTNNGRNEIIECENLVLAIGHSARDTFEMINKKSIAMEQKPFSIGARIEHLQSDIDKIQYGKFAGKGRLGAADYKLAVHLENGRGVYTFCMCPGGTVVAAASEEGMVVTNGMSKFARSETNANSALLVGINPDDFGSEDVLAGIELQRKIERKAFEAGCSSYKAIVQRVGDFIKGIPSKELGSVIPSYTAGYITGNLKNILPDYVCDSMAQGIIKMDNKLKGFNNYDAVLTGVETRSSSPVRILRNENLESISVQGLYPCGEGAGYAGGIMSAAADGIKCAEKILNK